MTKSNLRLFYAQCPVACACASLPVNLSSSRVLLASLLGLALFGPPIVAHAAPADYFREIDLVSDLPTAARFQDPDLVNPWGLASAPEGQFWTADNGSGNATAYGPAGVKRPAVAVVIANPTGNTTAHPTGEVFNGDSHHFNGDRFIFATEEGAIVGWQPSDGNTSVVRVNSSGNTTGNLTGNVEGAVYKGLALADTPDGSRLYAADFHNNKIDVFDDTYAAANTTGNFTDPNAPPGYAPFNVVPIDGRLYVTYALQDAAAHDDVEGAGNGFISIFRFDGTFVRRFATGSNAGGKVTTLDAPWGLAEAPRSFGSALADRILVGNFGSGQIAVFKEDGAADGVLLAKPATPLVIDGLWSIVPERRGWFGDPKRLYFTAGPDAEAHGLFGVIQPKGSPEPEPDHDGDDSP